MCDVCVSPKGVIRTILLVLCCVNVILLVFCILPGHPLAASGSRITAHLVHEMRRRDIKRSIGSACIGGGQGISVLLEKC